MKQLLFLLLLGTGLSGNLLAQSALMGEQLRDALAHPDSPTLTVDVILQDQVDFASLNARFEKEEYSPDQRARSVIRHLKSTAVQTQTPLLGNLEVFEINHPGTILSTRSLWILNMLVVEATPEVIRWLGDQPEVYYLDLSSTRTVHPVDDPLPQTPPAQLEKGPGGREPGIDSVNAPAMWARGYSGKGRLCFNLDTGIWDDHPAFASRFLAHHFPISQAWYGYDAVRPLDKEGSHGTHTLGTELGLDETTQDTIGLAFNARWIASDPVATSLATVKPLSEFMFAFEWALNPDGDTATTRDIPDVINNSWGYDSPGDTSLCFSYVSQVLDAVEAAGIANVFSAGNDGPNMGTISEPHHISTGLVNTFTVGAVNHYNAGSPIASFSSRGPTNCPATDALLIKPEVVAPGVNVRSSVGHSGYASYQGTSMAAPHVTGCVLLLKEAFPNVTGKEILEALYYSARDMGVAGEDNTYGRGMIDVDSAYNYLANSHTPVPPDTAGPDLAITGIIAPTEKFVCDPEIYPQAFLKNIGTTPLAMDTVFESLPGSPPQYGYFGLPMPPGFQTNIYLPPVTLPAPGNHELLLRAPVDTSITEADTINNRRIIRVNLRNSLPLPWLETFDQTDLQDSDWWVETYDVNITWDTAAAGGLPGSIASAWMNFPDYSPKTYQRDELISPALILPDSGAIALSFYYAYQHRHNIFNDSMEISLSTDCGQTWTSIWYKGGRDLSTHETVTTRFVPSDPAHWRQGGADLSAYAGSGKALLKFTSTNSLGNNLFLDSIAVYLGAPPVGIPELQRPKWTVYPNPTVDQATLKWETIVPGTLSIRLLDLTGRELSRQEFQAKANGKRELDLSGLPAGVYLIAVDQEQERHFFKLVKGN